MSSIWTEQTQFEKREKLTKDIYTPVAVIGAGISGILTAYFLKKHGIECVVLERSRICSGQTQNTTAKITAQHADIYRKIIKLVGEEKARIYFDLNQNAIDEYEKIIKDENIDCDFKRVPSYLYTTNNEELIAKEAQALSALSIKHIQTVKTGLTFDVRAAIKLENQARFDPLKFLKPISEKVTVYENTPVKSIDKNVIFTDEARVTADHIVFSCHFPFVNFPGMYFMKMHQERSYVCAFENAEIDDALYYSVDEDGLSLRKSGKLVLAGAGGHRTGENESGGKYNMIIKKAEQIWEAPREVARWSAQDCMTGDGIAYIGSFSKERPNWFVQTGYNKWGMSTSMAAAKIISECIISGEYKETVFSAQRSTDSAVFGEIIKDASHAAASIASRFKAPCCDDIGDLKCGQAAICKIGNEKKGVYKDKNSKLHAVSLRCPHLGCELKWNNDDKTWECPCHGSKFSYEGKLLCEPAQAELEYRSKE